MIKKGILSIMLVIMLIGITMVPMSIVAISNNSKQKINTFSEVNTATLKWAIISGYGEWWDYNPLHPEGGWRNDYKGFGGWGREVKLRGDLTVNGYASEINGEKCNKLIKIELKDGQTVYSGVPMSLIFWGKCIDGHIKIFGFKTWKIS